MKKCKNCTHWNPRQSELEYSKFYGICTCHKWKFTATNDADICILDRGNKSSKHMFVHRVESTSAVIPIGDVSRSRYCFVTEGNFRCIHHSKKR